MLYQTIFCVGSHLFYNFFVTLIMVHYEVGLYTTRGTISPKVLREKILRFFGLFGDIGTFGDMVPEIKIIVQK